MTFHVESLSTAYDPLWAVCPVHLLLSLQASCWNNLNIDSPLIHLGQVRQRHAVLM